MPATLLLVRREDLFRDVEVGEHVLDVVVVVDRLHEPQDLLRVASSVTRWSSEHQGQLRAETSRRTLERVANLPPRGARGLTMKFLALASKFSPPAS